MKTILTLAELNAAIQDGHDAGEALSNYYGNQPTAALKELKAQYVASAERFRQNGNVIVGDNFSYYAGLIEAELTRRYREGDANA